jgi:fructose PTS system EIIBC or EIIC component
MIQGLHRYLSEDAILLDLDERLDIPEESEVEDLPPRQRHEFKKQILQVMVELMDQSGKIVNPSKCLTDLANRESKATTGMGLGLAMPHVRTMQARELVMAVMRSERGLYFNSLDRDPVHVFIGMVGPPYDDKLYLRFMSSVAQAMQEEALLPIVMGAETPRDIYGTFCRMRV